MWRGKALKLKEAALAWCFITLCSLNGPSAWKQLSSWAILALTSRSSLMSSICKKTGGGKKEPVIREIKSYVYSVTPHILWSAAKCGVLEGKQIACPGTRLCLFLLLSLESHKQMWTLKMNVQLKTAFGWFISFMVDCRNTLSYLQEVFQPAAGTCQEPRSLLLTSRVVPCSYIHNLGWSLYIFVCLLSSPSVSNIATWWRWAVVFISVWRALLCLCLS